MTASSQPPERRPWRWAAGLGLGIGASLAVLLAWLAATRPADLAWQRVVAGGVVVFATDASYPPFSAVDPDGHLFGFDVDLAEALAGRLSRLAGRPVRAEFEALAYDALLPALVAGRDDAVISALVPQPERLNDVTYSRPYFVAGTVAVARAGDAPAAADAAGWRAWAAGKRLAVEQGAGGDVLARAWARQGAALTVLARPSADEALQAVETGGADAALVDLLSALDYVRGRPQLALAGRPLDPEPYVVAVGARSPTLARALDEALAELETDGSLSALRQKWFGDPAAGAP